jgi:hypothetical protein
MLNTINKFQLIKFSNKLRKHFANSKILFKSKIFNFSSKDEAFWEEYSKRKAQGGRSPALESQEIIFNKTVHSWKYSGNHSLSSDEFISCLRDLEKNKESPFVIIDVREEIEYDIYKLPRTTKVTLK